MNNYQFITMNTFFRFYMRFTLYIGIVMLFSLLLLPIAIFRPGNVHNTVYESAIRFILIPYYNLFPNHLLISLWLFSFRLVAYVLGPVLNSLLGMKWHIRNQENFVSDGSIICANHQSCLDFLGI